MCAVKRTFRAYSDLGTLSVVHIDYPPFELKAERNAGFIRQKAALDPLLPDKSGVPQAVLHPTLACNIGLLSARQFIPCHA